MSPIDPEREAANLRAMLEDEMPAGFVDLLRDVRPFTGEALALMQLTKNEWLKRVPVDKMESSYFATLAWLFILKAPESKVLQVAFEPLLFRKAVLEFGKQITGEQLAAADSLIQHTLGLVEMAHVSVKAKPSDPKPESEPPNS